MKKTKAEKDWDAKVKRWAQNPIYLLWARSEKRNGIHDLENVDLRAVDTDREKAEIHRDMILKEAREVRPDITAVWIEKRVSNHLYGQRDLRLAFRISTVEGVVRVRDGD